MDNLFLFSFFILLLFLLLLLYFTTVYSYKHVSPNYNPPRKCPIGCVRTGNKFGCPNGNFCYKDQCCKYDFDCKNC